MDPSQSVPVAQPEAPKQFTVRVVLGTTWDIYKKHFWVLYPLLLVVYVPTHLLAFSVQDPNTILRHIGWVVLFALFSFIAPFWLITCMSRAVRSAHEGAPVTLANAFKGGSGWLRLFVTQLLVLAIISGVVTVAILVVLLVNRFAHALLVPVEILFGAGIFGGLIYYGINLSFVSYIVPLSGVWGLQALRASCRLVKNNWWRVLGYSLLLGLVVTVVSMLVGIPYGIALASVGKKSLVLNFLYSLVSDAIALYAFIFGPLFYLMLKKEKGE